MGRPAFFTDRSLGDKLVPHGLRSAGWVIVTMRERYGAVDAQSLSDLDWIAECAARGEVMLTADKKIAKRPVEARAVIRSGARIIAMKDGRTTAEHQLKLFEAHRASVFAVASLPGPFVRSLSTRGLTELSLDDSAVSRRD